MGGCAAGFSGLTILARWNGDPLPEASDSDRKCQGGFPARIMGVFAGAGKTQGQECSTRGNAAPATDGPIAAAAGPLPMPIRNPGGE